METADVTDLYQASFFLVSGCSITGVECIPVGNGSSCCISVKGDRLAELAQAWFDRSAVVNLWAFRNAYSEINSHVQNAKRSFELTQRFRGSQS